MFGEYGYMEEGKLGKAYDLAFLKRLGHYALPYMRIIILALSLSMLIALMDLALPYLSKIAIDRYILPTWYRIQTPLMEEKEQRDFLQQHQERLAACTGKACWYISQADLKKIDPQALHQYRLRGILGEKGFYRVSDQGLKETFIGTVQEDITVLEDHSLMVPFDLLRKLNPGQLLKVRSGDIQGLTKIGILLCLLVFIAFGLGYGEYYLLELIGQRIMQDIRLQLSRRMISQGISFFDRNPVGRLVTRVTNDIENLNEMFKSVMITLFKDIFILTGIVALLLYLNWRLALFCFLLIPFIFGITLLFSSMARDVFRELRAKVAKLNAFLQERISGMRTIQLFATEAFQEESFAGINHENYVAGMKQVRVFALFLPLMELFASFAVAILIWYGGGKVISDQLTLGSLVAFVSYIQMFFRPIRDISEKYNIMQSAMASTERIFEFMDLQEEIREPEYPERPAQVEGRLEFRDVSFGYKEDRPVLHKVSFEMKPGEMVAIVGPTGTGKTTVVSLVERFYDPGEGTILLDGLDLRRWSTEQLRSQIGLVTQDVFIFSSTLGENISLGREDLSPESIDMAISQANADGVIDRLPSGLAQEVGEEGSNLSAGERQLLSFARALTHNPKVLILDEATSSVDPETERLIQEAIFHMTKARSTLVVAHRLSTIRRADRILVMHQGHIREQGTHEELMALGGIYYKLNRFQEM